MTSQLQILHLEDDLKDAELVQETLAGEGLDCNVLRVETREAFIEVLARSSFDLILADYTLPSFDGISALKIARRECPQVPFIFVSGTLDEEVAIEALNFGATDYVFKTRLSRMVPSARRALREAAERLDLVRSEAALRRSETYLAEAQKVSRTGSFGWNPATGEVYWSRETLRIFECEPDTKVNLDLILQRIHPDDRAAHIQLLERVARERQEWDIQHRLLLPGGAVKHLRVIGHPSHDGLGRFEFVGAVMDVTARKQADEALRRSESYLAEAQRLTHTGSWAWNVRTGDIFWSREIFRIYDVDPDRFKPSWEFILESTHPEDRAEMQKRAFMETTQKERVDSEGSFRILLPSGEIKHLHTIAHPIKDSSGEITEVVGTVMDVTEQHESRLALETAFAEIRTLKDQLFKENIALRDEVDTASMFEEIVGDSQELQAVLARLSKVAPTDSTVLITGETGTGKELIARAIHKRSRRASRAFVSVNCAAIPSTLIASELFGHEKGAFTGALHRRLGRFELAEGGTIFLDEIGELPLETQIALLRVLQEREFERIGGTQPIHSDVRVITATNRNLQESIAVGSFRKDLFYRLNVFPIEIPPLRDRQEDIPTLVGYFIHRYSRKSGKKIATVEKRTMELLQSYAWPGNIRELQNVIERSLIVCETDTFSIDPSWLTLEPSTPSPRESPFITKSAAGERELIESALAATSGLISGPNGAAARLSLPPSTLESKIRALKINKYRFKAD
jgi:DNA-binding NtrC family response regulator